MTSLSISSTADQPINTLASAALRLPIFTPSSSGLDLLASAAAQASPPNHTLSCPLQLLAISATGPFNPAASLPLKVVKKILELEFVEMAEISISAAILCTRFPEKVPELWAYQATIVRAERNYEGKHWVTYDRKFRRQTLAKKDLNWSVMDPRLYNEAFTYRAGSIARCNFCLQDDHLAANCPHNPHRPYFGWFLDPAAWSTLL